MHTKWRLAQLVEIAALPSDRYDESLHNKGANMIVDLCVNHSLQSSEFVDRHEEEEEEEEDAV